MNRYYSQLTKSHFAKCCKWLNAIALLIIFQLATTPFNVVIAHSEPASQEDDGIKSLLNYYEKQIYFTQNKGQFGAQTLFRADFPLGQAVVTQNGIIVSTFDPSSVNLRQEEGEQIEEDIKNGLPWRPISSKLKGHAWQMEFLNHSSGMTVSGKEGHTDKFNYFKGNTQVTEVNNYAEVWYNSVYNKVDVRYYPSATGELEYDIICKPGFNKNNIAIKFNGIENVFVNELGHLILKTSIGNVDFPTPYAYQQAGNSRQQIAANYVVNGNVVTFQLGEYDNTLPLIIDPIALRWATWVNTNSTGDNHGHCIWVDPTDRAIYMVARVVGTTDLITTGAFDTTANGNLEMIVGKYLEPTNVGGSGSRVWQTYIGGSGDDNPYAMEQGPDGNLYITGYTSSTNYPLLGGSAFSGTSIDQRNQTTDNIFITKINKLGNSIKSSVIGGNGDDGSFDIRINEEGDIVVCGNHNSNNLATLYTGSGATDRANGTDNIDVIVFKINSDLSAIQWMKNYGGSATDLATIMLQNSGNGEIFVGGYTESSNFPTVSPRQSTLGGSRSGFIQKLNINGGIVWSSYFKSASGTSTSILCMEFNTTKDKIYFGGVTGGLDASNRSSVGAYDSTYNSGTNDFFVCLMDTAQTLIKSTYIGGSSNEVNMMGLNADLNNDVYVFGYTNSTNFPVSSSPNVPLQGTNLGSNDKVFLKLQSDLSSLIFSTYYGGSADDYDPVGERGIKFSDCRIYTIVTSKSNNVPMTQGTISAPRISTTPYEPGLVVWANPPDLLGNTINDDQTICAGTMPAPLIGSVPSYSLPTILRNTTTSAYPALPSATTYQWQRSTDQMTWTNISGATNQNLAGAEAGILFADTYFRRIIGGDACILSDAADQIVKVTIITVTGSVTDVSCFGGNTGSITASSDGAGPYSYSWSNGQTTQTATGLVAGTYSVTVTDGSGCSVTNSFTVGEPAAPLSATITPVQPTCAGGGNNGSACVSASGGTSGYTYVWSNNSTSNCISSLGAGQYDVTVTDAKGCTTSVSTTLINQNPPQVSIGSYGPYCLDAAAVTLVGNPSGGTFSGNGVTGDSFSPSAVGAGTHTITYNYTDPNGCSGSASTSIVVNALPVVQCSSAPATCGGSNGSASVNANGSGSLTYLWSNGSTSSSISGLSAGDYSVVVTDGNGCSAACTTTVASQGSNLSATCTPTDGTCQNNLVASASVTASGGTSPYTYLWSNGSTSSSISNLVAGSYSVVVTDANGCTAACTTSVDIVSCCDYTDGGTIGYDQSLCGAYDPDEIVNITSPSGGIGTPDIIWITRAYDNATSSGIGSWSVIAGATNLSYDPPTITSSQQYRRCARRAGCTDYIAESNIVTKIVWDTPTATCTPTDGTCQNNLVASASVTASGGTAPYTYLWSNGGTTSSISNLAAGSYSVVVTDAHGCTATCTTTVAITPCCNYTDGGSIGYNESQCGSYDPANIVNITSPSGGIGTPDIIWITRAYDNATSSGIGSWSVIAGATNLSYDPPTITSSQQYRRCARRAGCTDYIAESNIVTKIVWDTPTATCTPTDGTCQNNLVASASVTASGGTAPYTYLWSNGGTTSSISNLAAGSYSVVVTDAHGCTATCTTTVAITPCCNYTDGGSIGYNESQCGSYDPANIVNITSPSGGIGTPDIIWITRAYDNATSSGIGSWSVIAGATGLSYDPTTITSSRQYRRCARRAGCTDYIAESNIVTKIVYQNAPVCSISGASNNIVCQGGSVLLCATAGTGYTYLWNDGSTSQCLTVTIAGTYSVTVTNADGCSTTCTRQIAAGTPPSCSITGPSSICQGGSAQLCAPAGYSYLWSNGSTLQCISVSAGTYTLTVTDANGCSSTCSKTVTVNPLPSCSITGPSSICQSGSAQLCAPAGYSYLWSNGSTSQCITVSAGTYSVTITNSNGCSSTCSKTVTVNPLPSCSITGPSSICQGGSAQLCAPAGYSYLWSNGSTSQCITVSAGTYSVTITNSSGCSSTCSKTVTVNPLPSCSITGPSSICQGGSAQLCAPAGYSYLWSNGSTSQCITVTSAATYSVTITNSNGCSSTCSKTITVNPLPSCAITGPSSICQGITASLCAPSGTGYTYLWSNGSTSRCITINCAGTYTVTVYNNGCSSTCSKVVTVNSLPSSTITGPSSFCQGSSASLCAPSGTGYTYVWSNGATSRCITVTAAGYYTVTVTNSNGCTSSSTKCVTVTSVPVCSITGCSSNTICQGGSTSLCAPSGIGYSYLWSNGATTRCINVYAAGTYTVRVTNSNGCYSTCSRTITVTPPPSCTITGNTSICPGGTTSLCAPSGTGLTYLWSNGATTRCITVNCAGTFTVRVTNSSGCYSNCSATVTVASTPSSTITSSCNAICSGQMVSLCAPSGTGLAYLWSNGATTRCINVSVAGTYNVRVTNSAGCYSVSYKTISSSTAPSSTITGCTSICQGQSGSLCAPSGTGYTYLWSNGATTRCINVNCAGTYTVTVTNSSGCSSTSSRNVTVNPLPSCVISGTTVISVGQSTCLCAPAGSGYTYWWSNGATTRCITVCNPGTYSVSVTNSSGCSKSCSVVVTRPRTGCRIAYNGNDGRATAETDQSASLFTYEWNTDPVQTTQSIAVKTSGWYEVSVTDADGNTEKASAYLNVNEINADAYPNPFKRFINIDFTTSMDDNHAVVEIYTLDGRLVTTLFNGAVTGREHYTTQWDALHDDDGIYIYSITTGQVKKQGRIILLKD